MDWLAIGAVVTVGLMVGVELSVAFVVNPIFDRLPEDAGVLARSDGARLLGRTMPVWYIGSLLLSIAMALLRPDAADAAWAAAGLLTASVVMSIALLVPINDRSKTWTPESVPADWREQRSRWDRLHVVRVAMIAAAFVVLTAAAVD